MPALHVWYNTLLCGEPQLISYSLIGPCTLSHLECPTAAEMTQVMFGEKMATLFAQSLQRIQKCEAVLTHLVADAV